MDLSSQLFKGLAAVVGAILLILILNSTIAPQAPGGKIVGGFDLARAVGLDNKNDAKAAAAPKADAPKAEAKAETKAEAPKAEAPKPEAPKAEAAKPAEKTAAAAPAAATAPAPAAGGFDAAAVAKAVATASADNGAAVWKKCAACHVVKADGPSTVGPNLWGVVGRKVASREDFASKYSEPLKAKGGEWGLAELAAFINSPAGNVAGTKMSFPGIKDPNDLADLLAYLSAQK